MSVSRVFFLVCALFLLATGVANAATGAEIPELTGGAQAILEGLRFTDFVFIAAVVTLGFLFWQMYNGSLSGGMMPVIIGLVIIGVWMGAEAVADAIYTSSAIL